MRYSAESGIYLGVRRLETVFVAKRRLKRGVSLDGKVDRMVDRRACGEAAVESALTLSPGMTAVVPEGFRDADVKRQSGFSAHPIHANTVR